MEVEVSRPKFSSIGVAHHQKGLLNGEESLNNGYYTALDESTLSSTFDYFAGNLVTRVLQRIKVPIEIRQLFIEELLEMRFERFDKPATEYLLHSLNQYYLQDEVYRVEGSGKGRPNCTSLEYSFFSARKERRIWQEDLFKESPFESYEIQSSIDIMTGKSKPPEGDSASEGFDNIDDKFLVNSLIERAGLNVLEEAAWRANKLLGLFVRDISEMYGVPKSTIGDTLKSASNKVEAQYWKDNLWLKPND